MECKAGLSCLEDLSAPKKNLFNVTILSSISTALTYGKQSLNQAFKSKSPYLILLKYYQLLGWVVMFILLLLVFLISKQRLMFFLFL